MASSWGNSWLSSWGVSWGGGVTPPAPPSGGFAFGGGGKGENLDELELFKRLQRKLKAGVSLAQALKEENEDEVETVREALPRKVGQKAQVRPRDPTVLRWVASRVEMLEARIERYRLEQEEEEEEVINLLLHLL